MWLIEFLNDEVRMEMVQLPRDMQAKFEHITVMIKDFGLEKVREPYVKHVEGKIWEIRLKGRDGIARSLYVTATGKRLVIVRTFVKKTQQTPRKEIEIALERAKEVK
jgi:phage-related protein